MTSEKFKSKADLMLRIDEAKLLLNGRYRDGTKSTFASIFKFTRYAIVLLAAIRISNFEYLTKEIKNTTCISYYDLYKVARFLGLDFERTKSAQYVYKELIERRHVKRIVANNKTFITFTERGRKTCEEKLEELQQLNEEFNSNPIAEQMYREKQDTKERVTKGSSKRRGLETKIDRLIRKISQW